MSPERAGTPQEESATTPKMSVPGSPVAGTPSRDAQSAFSFLLAVAQSQTQQQNGTANKTPDDDLTSLTWLQDRDLLKGMNLVSQSPSNSVQTTPNKWNATTNGILSDQSPTSDYVDDSSISAADSSSSSLNSPIPQTHTLPTPLQQQQMKQQAQTRYRHPHTIPYDPMVHITNKPPYSFSCLIFMAIEDSERKALPVKEIYSWIMDHFPYFKTAPTGWKNSVRHNLSLNKCFQKVEKAPNLGKGSLWKVDQQYRPNLLQALTRSPFHPCSTLDPGDYYNKAKVAEKTYSSRLPNPEFFPFLSNEMSKLVKTENSDTESLDEADAAAVMLSLRNGPRQRANKRMIITNSPSQDHTYSAAENQNGSNDEAFESDEEKLKIVPIPALCVKIDFEDDEQRRIKESAETLLHLAGVGYDMRKRPSDTYYDEASPTKRTHLLPDDGELDMEIKCEPEEVLVDEKPVQFQPRMLRKKSRFPPNNNNSLIAPDNEWAKQRRELELDQSR
ncbi:uncharacterized protein [Atheta coriaria]|uniref:uncharacterized protein isoform X1 n=1 Tax=Dalotia coriaria TaxID=877792 RepID=UPI0031F3D342